MPESFSLYLEQELERLEKKALLRFAKANLLEKSEGILDFTSNDYLALSDCSALLSSQQELEQIGAGASRVVSGTKPAHKMLESEIAEFMGFESSLVFGAGYLANIGFLSAVLSLSLIHI